MDKTQQTTEKEVYTTLREIRTLMKRSSRFLNVSPYAPVIVGIYAMATAWAISHIWGGRWDLESILTHSTPAQLRMLTATAFGLIALSIFTAASLCFFEARRQGERITIDATTRRLLWNLFMPLITGGLLCIGFLMNGYYSYLETLMLGFYGRALISASAHTFSSVRYLGYGEIILGIAAAFFPSYGLIFWAAGFGCLNILYGFVFILTDSRQ